VRGAGTEDDFGRFLQGLKKGECPVLWDAFARAGEGEKAHDWFDGDGLVDREGEHAGTAAAAAGATVPLLLLQMHLRMRVDVAVPVLFTMQQSLCVGGARCRWCASSYYVPAREWEPAAAAAATCFFLCCPRKPAAGHPPADRPQGGRGRACPVVGCVLYVQWCRRE